MPVKISDLPLAGKLNDDDVTPIMQDGATKRLKWSNLVTQEEYDDDVYTPEIIANDNSMYSFGTGDGVDYSDSVRDGVFESAILLGNTLVNINKEDKNEDFTSSDFKGFTCEQLFKGSTDYTVIFTSSLDNLQISFDIRNQSNTFASNSLPMKVVQGVNVAKVTTLSTLPTGTLQIMLARRVATTNPIISNVFLFEGDLTKQMPPIDKWFAGIQSSKMPILRTSNKQLFSGEIVKNKSWNADGVLVDYDGASATNELCKLDFSKTYVISNDGVLIDTSQRFFDKNKKYISGKWGNEISNVPSNTEYIGFQGASLNDCLKFQIEQGTKATPHEPYKSNILSCLEPVELNKIFEYEDILNVSNDTAILNTNTVIFNGSENWLHEKTKENTIVYKVNIPDRLPTSTKMKSNMFTMDYVYDSDMEGIQGSIADGTVWVSVSKNKALDITAWKQWLASNPLSLCYPLKEKIVKKVSLSGQPIGFKGGHIIKEVEAGSINYGLKYSAATSKTTQITQNTIGMLNNTSAIAALKVKTATNFINHKCDLARVIGNTKMNVNIDDDSQFLCELINDLIDENETNGLLDKLIIFKTVGMISEDQYNNIIRKLYQDATYDEV